MKNKITCYLCLLLLVVSCQTVKLIKNQDLVSEKFLTHIREAKTLVAKGQNKEAWTRLGELNNWNLNDTENSLADNLRGSILFRLNKYPTAEKYFKRALTGVTRNSEIDSQVRLNLSSLYFKQEKNDESWKMLSTISPDSLYAGERKKYHIFKYKLAKKLNVLNEGVASLIKYFEGVESYQEIVDNPVSQHLIVEFSKLEKTEQESLLSNISEKNFAEVLVIQKYLNEYMYLANESEVDALVSKLGSYSDDPMVLKLYEDFNEAKEGSQSFDNQAIGVIVPLSGKMARFGKSVLKGIDLALFDIYGDKKPKVFVQDSHGNGVAAKLAVKELVEKHKVSYIVGGVFTKTASTEYLEAKKYGTLFFSLSPIYLSFAEKNSMLFEVFGSIESQVSEVLSDENLDRNGKNFVMIYPDSEAGRSYYNEVLRQAPQRNAVLMDSINFLPNVNNHQETVKKLLGVGYVKKYVSFGQDEAEEGDLGGAKKIIYVPVLDPVEDKSKNKKVKNIKLNLDYNWVYVPALPNDALQVIPSFRYFEARGLKYYGGPSWKTKTFLNRHIGLGKLLFISSENSILQERFSGIYRDRFQASPGIVEGMAYESISLGKRLLENNANQRSQVVQFVTSLKFLEGFSSSWHKQDGIWFKDMDTFKINNRSVQKVY